MIGLCQRCGFMGDKPAKGQSHRDAWAKLWKKVAQVQHRRLAIVWKDYYLIRQERDRLMLELAEKDVVLQKLDTVLEILMSTSEAARISTVSKLKKKFKSGQLLASIREANRE